LNRRQLVQGAALVAEAGSSPALARGFGERKGADVGEAAAAGGGYNTVAAVSLQKFC